ncbi:hypothetical protein [Dechloromonas sp. A34]|uniref:hypothetical protein n=1 Tax=Dechloromonas sp. A34 TaxID=447588 RepID=UPI002248EC7D|nr:hypothetical protein [Dechloromonas sp. A34]
MSNPVFELIDNTTFRVGERIVSCHFSDPPFDGKYRYHADGTSNERDHITQHLFVHDFRNICPSDLPNGISINIQYPKSEFRHVNFAEIKKANDQSELIIVLCFDYVDWHLPINLHNFAERYRDALLHLVDGATQSNIDQSEPGLFVTCSISVVPDTDYLSTYRKAVSQILATYRKCLEDIYKQPLSKESKPIRADDNTGAKWWFRYVIVPILGSGAVAAIAAGLIALAR